MLPCPSCGGEVLLHSYTPYVVCSYCRHILVRAEDQYQDSGEVSDVADDISPFQIGTEGWYKGVHFGLVGRLRMSWDDGYWNEWYAYFDDGRFGWLAEAQGNLAILFEREDTSVVAEIAKEFRSADGAIRALGREISIDNVPFGVSDIKIARCLAVEGEVPKLSLPGKAYRVIDLLAGDGSMATIELAEQPHRGRLFVGEYTIFPDLQFTGLRELEGWSSR